MKLPQPRTPAAWLKEIKLAIADAAEAAPLGPLVGTEDMDANLFHLAPLVCLKFRGRKLKGREAERVTKVALANSASSRRNSVTGSPSRSLMPSSAPIRTPGASSPACRKASASMSSGKGTST